MPPARTRDRLLDAAGTVVMRDGAQALTLDAVALEAEFSREMDEADPAFVRGYVKASGPVGNELGMLAALVGDPSLLVAVRKQYGIWQDRVEREGRDPVDATVARL